jgi:tetratricopeptide (TPR) repeat protein
MKNRDFQHAEGEYRAVIGLDPANAEAHARLGMLYQDEGRVLEAVNSLKQALQFDPRLPRVGILLALNYLGLGRYADALPYLEKAFSDEQEPSMHSLLGQRLVDCYFALDRKTDGLATTERLLKVYPDDPDVLYTAIKVYATMWNDTVQALLTKAPGSYRIHQVLAEVLETQEKYAEAANEYRQILKLDARLPGTYYRLGKMIQRADPSAKGHQEALAAFRKELEINPNDVPTSVEIGELYLKDEQLHEAKGLFSHALELQPSNAKARVGLAKVLLADKKYREAVEQLEQAARIAPEEEAVQYNLMIAYRSLGLTTEARQAFEAFQKLKEQKKQRLSSILKQFKGSVIQVPNPDR